jgi:hypothetical protein
MIFPSVSLRHTPSGKSKLVPIHKWPICPISALREKFNPRNINHMPAVKFFVRLDLEQICLFLDGHKLICCRSCQEQNSLHAQHFLMPGSFKKFKAGRLKPAYTPSVLGHFCTGGFE